MVKPFATDELLPILLERNVGELVIDTRPELEPLSGLSVLIAVAFG